MKLPSLLDDANDGKLVGDKYINNQFDVKSRNSFKTNTIDTVVNKKDPKTKSNRLSILMSHLSQIC